MRTPAVFININTSWQGCLDFIVLQPPAEEATTLPYPRLELLPLHNPRPGATVYTPWTSVMLQLCACLYPKHWCHHCPEHVTPNSSASPIWNCVPVPDIVTAACALTFWIWSCHRHAFVSVFNTTAHACLCPGYEQLCHLCTHALASSTRSLPLSEDFPLWVKKRAGGVFATEGPSSLCCCHASL